MWAHPAAFKHRRGRTGLYAEPLEIQPGFSEVPFTQFEVVREGPATAVADGHDGMGQVIGKRSMRMAIAKAKLYGMGMVAVRN
ncbi:MAG: Ldh family oxidoreductase [Spirochaetaceae bacterium]|jgi:hypothetical protein|nr:Ldh family oxidoreductase [Spirochaetaceae bacterium]